MFFDPRIGARPLAALSRRLGTSIDAGVDMRTIWQREADRQWPARHRHFFADIYDSVSRGVTLTDAIQKSGEYFPSMWREMVTVGEESGKLGEVFRNLAEQYEFQVAMAREFRRQLTWPMIQLGMALMVVAGFITVIGMLPAASQEMLKPITFGLVGEAGAFKFLCGVGAIVAGVWFFIRSAQRGLLWVKPVQRLAMLFPIISQPFKTLGIARFAWAGGVTLGSGMAVERALPLSLRATHNAFFTDAIDQVTRQIRAGRPVNEALADTHTLPAEFLDAMEVGENSGRLPETMDLLSRDYQDRSRASISMLTSLTAYLIWACVMLLLIWAIARLFNAYMDQINSLL